ncbi:MAG TPA: putative baseplate assembly protein, partial [Oculatellaceae cyanobacterium]
LELISEDGEKKTLLRPDDVLQVLEPPVKGEYKVFWKLMDRNGFKGSVTAPDGSILLEPAAQQSPGISEVAVLEGIFENALPKMLKVVEEAFKGDVSKAKAKGLKGTGTGEAFEGGYYQVVGWNGESYIALGGKVNKLVKLVVEQGASEENTVNEGEVWGIDGGWELVVQKIITATGPDTTNSIKVQMALIKDGIKKDEKEIAEGNVYTYVEKSIAGETDVPLFVTYIDAIFSEAVFKKVNFKYTWAVSTNITQINIGNKFALPDDTPGTRERTILVLEKALQNSYDPFTVVINANIARATHGETVHEVLGSGNGAQANQRFTLKKQPVTYVSAPTPSGTESTIEVRVNDVKWEEVPSLYGLDERDRGYIARMDDEGNSTLIFGDGKSGTRIPTGQENVTATYRAGIGTEGMVRVGQLSLLMTRPLGVRDVINPLAPTGAANPESRDQAKQNAPQKVLTLDRIVSLQDFEDFAHAFAGIGKAQASWLWDGERRFVHITVASASAGTVDSIPELYKVDKTSDLYKNLVLGIERAKDPVQQFHIDSFNPLFFNLSASALIDSRYIKERVLAAVSDSLRRAFSFEQRSFGQAVTGSEVLAVMQRVEGVIAIDLNALYLKGEPPGLKTYLEANRARQYKGFLLPADLLTFNPEGIELKEMVL